MKIEVEWKGLEIHPEFPPEGIPVEGYFNQGYIASVWRNVRALANQAGMEAKLPARLSKSEMALLGGQFSQERGQLKEYSLAVYEAYFLQGKDIGNLDVLQRIQEEVGLDSEEFRACLAEGKLQERLQTYRREAEEACISGVPTLILGGARWVGAQPYSVLKEAVMKTIDRIP